MYINGYIIHGKRMDKLLSYVLLYSPGFSLFLIFSVQYEFLKICIIFARQF